MQTLMPDGKVLTEFFKDMDELRGRQRELQRQGGKTLRIVRVYENQSRSKYEPHQGKKEAERRLRQAARVTR